MTAWQLWGRTGKSCAGGDTLMYAGAKKIYAWQRARSEISQMRQERGGKRERRARLMCNPQQPRNLFSSANKNMTRSFLKTKT